MRAKLGYMALGALLLGAFAVFVIAIGSPLWLEIVAIGVAGAIWFRYRWHTGIREEHHAAVARGRAKGLAKRDEREARKRRKRG